MAAVQPPILEIKGLSKSFAGTQVLNGINLDVPRGSIVSLLGRSGSGKTTLLQLIAGFTIRTPARLPLTESICRACLHSSARST